MKYVDSITQSKEAAEKSLAPARAKEQEAALGIAIAQLDLEVQTKNNAISALKQAYPLDVDAIVDAGDDLALDERRLAQLKSLNTELFGS
jgi:hypothetical protein